MTFDREPDLDNANVGMPEKVSGITKYKWEVTKSVASFFYCLEVKRVIKMNGENFDIAGESIEKILRDAGYDTKRVAVELNGEILPKSQYESTYPVDGDNIEIVSFVGGG